jgi:hypothetical protein
MGCQKRLGWEISAKHGLVLLVEASHGLGVQSSADPGARPNAPEPGFMAIGHVKVEGEAFDVTKACLREIIIISGIGRVHPSTAPSGIVFHD